MLINRSDVHEINAENKSVRHAEEHAHTPKMVDGWLGHAVHNETAQSTSITMAAIHEK